MSERAPEAFIYEADVEALLLSQLATMGYVCLTDADAGPDGRAPERESHSEVFLAQRLKQAVERLNPDIPEEAREDALKKIMAVEHPGPAEENRRLHQAMVEGVGVEFHGEDGFIRGDIVRLIDFEDLTQNDWLAISQFTVIEGRHERRPDVVVFVNGLPLGVIELKNPGDERADLPGAYNQLQTYKQQIPSLFRANALIVISDGVEARMGSLTAGYGRFVRWRPADRKTAAAAGLPDLKIMIGGVFEKRAFLSLLHDFTVFGRVGGKTAKIVAGYHQFHAVHKAVQATLRAMPEETSTSEYGPGMREEPAVFGLPDAKDHPAGDRRIGVIWHTQGSGKSLLMVFYARQLIMRPEMENPTLVVITDRNDLDNQLFESFSTYDDLLRQTPLQAESRSHLRKLLNRTVGGVIFTTIQKFSPDTEAGDFPMLSDRRNVVVIADEAHRSQYGLKAKVKRDTGDISYGFAKFLRDALPNASFIGFTGTPVETEDANTRAVFGDYIDIYDISRAVEDGVTVPIYYQSRLAHVELDEDEKINLDEEISELTEDEALSESQEARLKQKWTTIEAVVGAEKRLAMTAQNIVEHYEERNGIVDGKAMIVCMSRRICVALYDQIVKLRPEWRNDSDEAGEIKIVMTGSASDPLEWQPHVGGKKRRDTLAKRAKDPDDPLKMVIVRDMWLTGFDAPCMHTMYIDKPMRGHGLMQAIARVNRVFPGKENGLVVDYIGVAPNLKDALRYYSDDDKEKVGIDEATAVAEMQKAYEIVGGMFHGFDYKTALDADSEARLCALAGAMDWVLEMQDRDAAKETTEKGKNKARRRFDDAVLALTKAFALAASYDAARGIREEVGFFQAVRGALAKRTADGADGGDGGGKGKSSAERDLAVQQIVSRAVISTNIVDILAAVGLNTPDISILSDEFLAEIQGMERKNLALEALKKLLNGQIQARGRVNVVQEQAFSERLENAIARYHSNAVTAVEVLQELIEIAKDIRDAQKRGEEEGLSEEEIAFYQALAQNKSAVEVMGDDSLRLIALEVLKLLKSNASVDWRYRESARARMRVLVKRTLRKHGYPPDLQNEAVQTVLKQAERWAAEWAG